MIALQPQISWGSLFNNTKLSYELSSSTQCLKGKEESYKNIK